MSRQWAWLRKASPAVKKLPELAVPECREHVANSRSAALNQHQRIRAHLAGMLFQLAQELTPPSKPACCRP
jgi:hypothetical protein